jgi:pimeloyl-ACP methyl ester carboxylesterase
VATVRLCTAADVEEVAAALRLHRLLVVGSSAGATYALALAALLPDRVQATLLISPSGSTGQQFGKWVQVARLVGKQVNSAVLRDVERWTWLSGRPTCASRACGRAGRVQGAVAYCLYCETQVRLLQVMSCTPTCAHTTISISMTSCCYP